MGTSIGYNHAESAKTERTAARALGELWCGLLHTSIKWPIRGHYSCATCGRRYPIPWDKGMETVTPQETKGSLAARLIAAWK